MECRFVGRGGLILKTLYEGSYLVVLVAEFVGQARGGDRTEQSLILMGR